jgi:hypothetical protein
VYIQKIIDVSGLKPVERNWLHSAETVEHFVARGLQQVKKMGRLDEIRVE